MGEAGPINLAGRFHRNDQDLPDAPSIFRIYVNGSQVHEASSSSFTPLEYDIDSTISVGQHVDFVLSADGAFGFDDSVIAATITPEPSRGLLSLVGVAAIALRRRRS